MKEPRPEDFKLTKSVIDWYPPTRKDILSYYHFPRKFDHFSTIGTLLFLFSFFLFFYLTWEVGGFLNIVDDYFKETDLTGLFLFSPIISGLIVWLLIPKLIRGINLFLMRKHRINIEKYDLEYDKYSKFLMKEGSRKKKIFLLKHLDEYGFNFPLFDKQNLSDNFKKLLKDCWKKIKELEGYYNKKFMNTPPKEIFKDLEKYRKKKVQNSFINLLGICHIMNWTSLRDIVYTFGIVLPFYDNRYSNERNEDFRKLKIDEFKSELERIRFETRDYGKKIIEEINLSDFRDLRFLEMIRIVTFLNYVIQDDDIFKLKPFRTKMNSLIPPSTEIDWSSVIINTKPRLNYLFEKDMMSYFDKKVSKLK